MPPCTDAARAATSTCSERNTPDESGAPNVAIAWQRKHEESDELEGERGRRDGPAYAEVASRTNEIMRNRHPGDRGTRRRNRHNIIAWAPAPHVRNAAAQMRWQI